MSKATASTAPKCSDSPGPIRQQMLDLATKGYAVREAWLGDYYDGLHAIKRIGGHVVEVYAGNADDGDYTDKHYAPVVYVDDRCVAHADTPARAERIADFRVRMFVAAIAKAAGAAA